MSSAVTFFEGVSSSMALQACTYLYVVVWTKKRKKIQTVEQNLCVLLHFFSVSVILDRVTQHSFLWTGKCSGTVSVGPVPAFKSSTNVKETVARDFRIRFFFHQKNDPVIQSLLKAVLYIDFRSRCGPQRQIWIDSMTPSAGFGITSLLFDCPFKGAIFTLLFLSNIPIDL